MTSDQSVQPGHPPGYLATAQLAAMLWQMPFILFSSWCNMATGACWRTPCPAHPHDANGQLVVPEPIEDTGEHALFA